MKLQTIFMGVQYPAEYSVPCRAWIERAGFFIVGVVTFFGMLLFLSASTVSAAACSSYQSGQAPPSGYGAAWNVLSSAKGLLLKSECGTSSVTLTVGTGDSLHYIYQKGYIYKNNQWSVHDYQGTFAGGTTAWLVGKGTYTDNNPPQGLFYWVGYVCQWTGSQWKCGCRDSACTQNYWQLQAFTYGGSSGGPGSSIDDSTPIPPYQHPSVGGGWVGYNKKTILAISQFTLLKRLGVQPEDMKRQVQTSSGVEWQPAISEGSNLVTNGGYDWSNNATLKKLGIEYPLFIIIPGSSGDATLSYGAPKNVVGRYKQDSSGNYGWVVNMSGGSDSDTTIELYLEALVNKQLRKNNGRFQTQLSRFNWTTLLPGQSVTINKNVKLKKLGIDPSDIGGNFTSENTLGESGGSKITIRRTNNSEGKLEIKSLGEWSVPEDWGDVNRKMADSFTEAQQIAGKIAQWGGQTAGDLLDAGITEWNGYNFGKMAEDLSTRAINVGIDAITPALSYTGDPNSDVDSAIIAAQDAFADFINGVGEFIDSTIDSISSYSDDTFGTDDGGSYGSAYGGEGVGGYGTGDEGNYNNDYSGI